MQRTFTLPTDLRTAIVALTEQEPCELVYQNRLIDTLTEEFENVSYSPDPRIVDKVLAYSKALEVKRSSTMVAGLQLMMN